MERKFIPEKRNEFEMDQIESYMAWTVDTGWHTKCGTIYCVCVCVTFILYRTNTVVLRDDCRVQHSAVMPGIRGRR